MVSIALRYGLPLGILGALILVGSAQVDISSVTGNDFALLLGVVGSFAVLVMAGFFPARASGQVRTGLLATAVVVVVSVLVDTVYAIVLNDVVYHSVVAGTDVVGWLFAFLTSGVPYAIQIHGEVTSTADLLKFTVYGFPSGVIYALVFGLPAAALGRWVHRRDVRAAVPATVGGGVP